MVTNSHKSDQFYHKIITNYDAPLKGVKFNLKTLWQYYFSADKATYSELLSEPLICAGLFASNFARQEFSLSQQDLPAPLTTDPASI